jgi:HD-GYP domain-containing protein (c-di-GMP phosphodiesterase class II)
MQDTYTQDFLRRFRENLNLKKQQQVFEHMLGKASWEILPAVGREKAAERFFEDGAGHGCLLPLKQGNQIYGYIVAHGFKYHVTDELMAVFTVFIETVMREVQKEMELTKLYDTIRPRAIALSTIHTVHRLMSSTLDLETLMPRIARLCLQVMRAQTCCILMLGKEKNKLNLKAAVKSDKDIKAKRLVPLTGTKARVVKTAASVLRPKQILVPLIDEDVIGIIEIHDKLGGRPFTEFDKEILITFAEQAVIAIQNAQLYEEQERLTIGSIKALAAILDRRPRNLYTNWAAFTKLVEELAKEVDMSPQEIRILRYAALLHDAGKMMIPDEILMKPRSLTGKEYEIVKKHPIKGVQIIQPMDVLKPVVPIILYHHEKFDGTGYPEGLKGKQIPLGSRIMAVVDAFIAMVSKQAYRERISVQEALSEIKRYSGTQFDPNVVDAFVRVVGRINVPYLLRMKSKSLKINKKGSLIC